MEEMKRLGEEKWKMKEGRVNLEMNVDDIVSEEKLKIH